MKNQTLQNIDPNLTTRELEIIILIGQGLSNFDIHERLFISQNTVKNHIAAIRAKTGMKNRVQIALYYHGIIKKAIA
jgi:DNA-binding CsgD family transcriptional regulator